MKKYTFTKTISSAEIRNFRKKYQLTRPELAGIVGCSVKTIEKWEQSDLPVMGAAAVLLNTLKDNSELLVKYELPELIYPLRLYYLDGNTVTTVIDVDELNRKIKIKNYTDEIVRRAFGNKTNVSFEDYENFLKSRCFPNERDKLKLELSLRELPFYDVYSIIAQTGGRMEGDSYRLVIERRKND